MRWLLLPAFALFSSVSLAADLPPDWAYKPIGKPVLPKTTAKNPIDAFILAKLSDKGLSLAAPADRRTLIRRVTFDLIGLPPAPEETEAFLRDKSPDAFEKVVDRLLSSPRYGERQALFWLDLVRFAESDGFKADDFRPTAWRYRDYVIQSFNADKPYDRFIEEQLAGDELFPGNIDAAVATGFLRHSPYEYNAIDVEQKRQDLLNDITDTTAAAFLGITLGCAKCHDHKTDPVTQRDYYRFQAFFAGFWPTEVPVLSAKERQAFEKKRTEWELKSADLRKQMAELEEPARKKAMAKERSRFPSEYSNLLDIPETERSPLQRQLGLLVGRQVSSRAKVSAAQMPAAIRPKWEGMAKQLAMLEKDRPADPPTAMAMSDLGPLCPSTHLLKRGNWRNPGEELEPGFLSAIDDRDADVKPTGKTSGRRSNLAKWIADAKNPLTARVMVNRLWQQHFGKGIVATASDFGVTGDRPTHPELLDWLAGELANPSSPVATGGRSQPSWSIKHIHRLIVTSATYRQAVAESENSLLHGFPRRRLDGEALRDAVLASAGLLNLKAGGPSVFPELPAEIKANNWKVSADPAERHRRSIYVCVKRNLRYPLFNLFDSPDRVETCARRFVTTTAPQALTMLNDAIVFGYAKAFAERVLKESRGDAEKGIERAFQVALSRHPSTEERAALRDYLKQHKGSLTEAMTDLCHSLLNLNEFLYVD
ncbi:MAG TPA: DUF1549 and DUF1553 domain-containing protein [Urbifossiella sp.]